MEHLFYPYLPDVISSTVLSNIQIQCNPHQNSNEILHRDRKINHKINWETQKTLKSQSSPEQKEKCLRYHNTRLQIILQSHNNKDSMVLAQKQTGGSMECNRRFINKPYSYSHLIVHKSVKKETEDCFFYKWVLGKLNIHM
jgi:hypothetical protein